MTAFKVTSETRPALDGSAFGASLIELHGRRMSVVRSITVNSVVDAFAATEESGHVTAVTIAPPAPFKGTGTFQRTRGSKGTWLGTLVGNFPGRSDVVLAGPEFSRLSG